MVPELGRPLRARRLKSTKLLYHSPLGDVERVHQPIQDTSASGQTRQHESGSTSTRPNLDDDFHLVGSVLKRAWIYGDVTHELNNIQMACVPAGGGGHFDVQIRTRACTRLCRTGSPL